MTTVTSSGAAPTRRLGEVKAHQLPTTSTPSSLPEAAMASACASVPAQSTGSSPLPVICHLQQTTASSVHSGCATMEDNAIAKELVSGMEVGPWRLTEKLGQGSYGAVWGGELVRPA